MAEGAEVVAGMEVAETPIPSNNADPTVGIPTEAVMIEVETHHITEQNELVTADFTSSAEVIAICDEFQNQNVEISGGNFLKGVKWYTSVCFLEIIICL